MIARHTPSALWQAPWPGLQSDLERQIENALDAHNTPIRVWFRADDVAAPGTIWTSCCDVFLRHRTPLSPALVPAWMSLARWKTLYKVAHGAEWGWHQHGWQHRNHEPEGELKNEFGSFRPVQEQRQDIQRGVEKLHKTIGSAFIPVFTPPWNRMSQQAILGLRDQGLSGLSRSCGSAPACPDGLTEFPVHVDLHTRRSPEAEKDRQALLKEFGDALKTGTCGFMLHHQRMNEHALAFLETLLTVLGSDARLHTVHIGELLHEAQEKCSVLA